jgi:hypothetical protein
MSISFIRAFTKWMLTVRRLSPQTATIYLSDLKHKLRGIDVKHFDDFITRAMIKGAANLSLYSDIAKKSKFVMTFPLLKLLGREIASQSWSDNSKRVLWTASCLAFIGSFRLGEILSPRDNSYDPETLTWSNVQIFKSHAIIHVRFPKNLRARKGNFVDVFSFPRLLPPGRSDFSKKY